MQRSAIPAPLPAVRMTYTNRSAMTPAAVPVRFAILSAIIRLWMIHSPEFHRVPLRQLKNPHGCLSPWINRTRCRKAKRPITDRPYIFVFYRNMKVKKGRRLVRSSVMLKRTAAIVPRAIKAGLSCNWCRVGPTVFHRPGPRTSGVHGA